MDEVAINILKLKKLVKSGQHLLKMQFFFQNGKSMPIKDQTCHVKISHKNVSATMHVSYFLHFDR